MGNGAISKTMSQFWIFLLVDINAAYICRGRFADNLEYNWLMMMSLGGVADNLEYDWLAMSLGGAVVSFYHVTI